MPTKQSELINQLKKSALDRCKERILCRDSKPDNKFKMRKSSSGNSNVTMSLKQRHGL